MTFQIFTLPIAILTLILVYFWIPNLSDNDGQKTSRSDYINGFMKIFSNRSAVTCIICAIFTEITWSITNIFGMAFLREKFLVPLNIASLLLMGFSACFAIGSFSGGYLVNKFGRKRVAIVSSFSLGLFSLAYINLNIYWLSIPGLLLACLFSSMRYTSSSSLSLEQVPNYRGTMMSMSTARAQKSTGVLPQREASLRYPEASELVPLEERGDASVLHKSWRTSDSAT